MKSDPGPPMTLGNAAAARVRLIVWRKGCQHHVEPDPTEQAQRYGAEMPFSTGASGWFAPNAAGGISIWSSPEPSDDSDPQNRDKPQALIILADRIFLHNRARLMDVATQNPVAQIRYCTCGRRGIEMRSSHPRLMS